MVVIVVCCDFPELSTSIPGLVLERPCGTIPSDWILYQAIQVQDIPTIKHWLVSARGYMERVGLERSRLIWNLDKIALLPYDILYQERLDQPLVKAFRMVISQGLIEQDEPSALPWRSGILTDEVDSQLDSKTEIFDDMKPEPRC